MPQMGPIIWPMFPFIVTILLALFFTKINEEMKLVVYSGVKNVSEEILIW